MPVSTVVPAPVAVAPPVAVAAPITFVLSVSTSFMVTFSSIMPPDTSAACQKYDHYQTETDNPFHIHPPLCFGPSDKAVFFSL